MVEASLVAHETRVLNRSSADTAPSWLNLAVANAVYGDPMGSPSEETLSESNLKRIMIADLDSVAQRDRLNQLTTRAQFEDETLAHPLRSERMG